MTKKKSSRRINGEGSIYYDDNKDTWVGITQVTVNNKKIRRKVTGKSKKEVSDKIKIISEELKKDNSNVLTVAMWLKEWMKVYIVDHVKVKTYERYQTAVYKHIVPYIGKEDIRTLSSIDVQRFINQLHDEGGEEKQGLSARTVNSARMVLKAALKQAVGVGVIIKNPAEFTKPIKLERAGIYVLSTDECRKLVEAAYQEQYKAYWVACLIALDTGLRKGEIFGLRWSDIDLEKKTLTVNATVINGNRGIMIQDSAKTEYSRRTIPISDVLVRKLKEYRQWQDGFLSAMQIEAIFKGFIITSAIGTLKDPNRFTSVVFKRILRRANISTSVRFHDLRHTHATQLLKAGVDVKTVSQRLGHSSIRITLDTYAHVLPEMQDHLMEKLKELNLIGS